MVIRHGRRTEPGIEPVVGVSDWQYRLVGQRLVTRYGSEWTGKHMSTLLDDAPTAEAIRFYDAVAGARAPALVTGRIQAKGHEDVPTNAQPCRSTSATARPCGCCSALFFHS
jgi:hypothetical protein